MNDLDVLCSEVVSKSGRPLCYIRRWISWKPLEIEAWFQRTTNRKWPTGNQMVTWQMTSRDPERSNFDPSTLRKQLEMLFGNDRYYYLVCCEVVRSAILATARLLVLIACILAEEVDFEIGHFRNFWPPWLRPWPWIGSYGIPSCSTQSPFVNEHKPTMNMHFARWVCIIFCSNRKKKLSVAGGRGLYVRTDGRADGQWDCGFIKSTRRS